MQVRKPILIGCVVVIILTVWISTTLADDDDDKMPLDLVDCKKIMGRIAKRTLKSFSRCTKELKMNVTGNKELFEKKLGCAIRCTLGQLNLLSDDGKVTREKVQKFMDETIPSDAHEFAHALSADCNESYGAKLDMTEEYCTSYSEYAQCMMSTIGDFADKTNCHPGSIGGGGIGG